MKVTRNSNVWMLAALLFGVAVNAVSQNPETTRAAEPPRAPAPQFATPDVYELAGGGISLTYLPTGADRLAHLTYRDTVRTLIFSGDQIHQVKVQALGTIVSVTIVPTVDSGVTTFSVLVPAVNLPNQRGASTSISSDGVTTVHKVSSNPALHQGQSEIYTVTSMTGTAALVIVPL